MTPNIGFCSYCNIKNFNSISLVSKHPILFSFYNGWNKFDNTNPRIRHIKDNKVTVYGNASELYNECL